MPPACPHLLACAFAQFAEHLKPLLAALPRDTPIVATHSLVGLIAVACGKSQANSNELGPTRHARLLFYLGVVVPSGFTRVINLVIDNHAQWFIVVPGAINLVQARS